MKIALSACALSLACALSASAQSSRPSSTAATVRSAQAVYREVEAALRQHRLARHDTTVTCSDDLASHASLFTDGNHRVRRLDTSGGTEDHAEQAATYFDTLGRPRFSFAKRGAVNGTYQEERAYYDEREHVVRRVVRQLHGPGYPFDTLTIVPRLATWLHDLCG